jgi:glutamate-1-semialdehyde 2,1-aminomutase
MTDTPQPTAVTAGPAELVSQRPSNPRVRAAQVLPGGYGRSTFMVGAGAPYALRGEGCRLWDDTGRVLIDLNNNFTTLIHGHAPAPVVRAAAEAMERGASFGLPNERELEHAEALLDRLPHADLVRYTNSGTEAVMTALRIARAHTGRSRSVLVQRAYHGTSDIALTAGDARSRRGLPPSVVAETTLLPLNDRDALMEAMERDGATLAAVLIDLMPNRTGLIAADADYVDLLAELTRAHGILLIVDEVISFRLGWSGRSPAYGLSPDLVVLGKLIGGGLPVGAVAGKREIMGELDPRHPAGLEHGGTFTANPVTMAAGAAALKLFDNGEIDRLNGLGDDLRQTLDSRLATLDWEVRGWGSLLRPCPICPPERQGELQRALWWAAYGRGLLLNPTGLIAMSTPMDRGIVDQVAADLVAAVTDVANGWRPADDGAPAGMPAAEA